MVIVLGSQGMIVQDSIINMGWGVVQDRQVVLYRQQTVHDLATKAPVKVKIILIEALVLGLTQCLHACDSMRVLVRLILVQVVHQILSIVPLSTEIHLDVQVTDDVLSMRAVHVVDILILLPVMEMLLALLL